MKNNETDFSAFKHRKTYRQTDRSIKKIDRHTCKNMHVLIYEVYPTKNAYFP